MTVLTFANKSFVLASGCMMKSVIFCTTPIDNEDTVIALHDDCEYDLVDVVDGNVNVDVNDAKGGRSRFTEYTEHFFYNLHRTHSGLWFNHMII